MPSSFLSICTRTLIVQIAITSVLAASAGCGNPDPLPPTERLTIKISSSAFADGDMIPIKFTCDGSDQSPPLTWSGLPEKSSTLALICDDPDAPAGTWSHWVVFNLPAQVAGLNEAVPPGESVPKTSIAESSPISGEIKAIQGKNDFGKAGYGGPCPPSGTHHYFIRLYALDTQLELGPKATRADVLTAIKGHILAEGRLIGKYTRGGKG